MYYHVLILLCFLPYLKYLCALDLFFSMASSDPIPRYFFSLTPSEKKYSPGASVVPASSEPIMPIIDQKMWTITWFSFIYYYFLSKLAMLVEPHRKDWRAECVNCTVSEAMCVRHVGHWGSWNTRYGTANAHAPIHPLFYCLLKMPVYSQSQILPCGEKTKWRLLHHKDSIVRNRLFNI